jgi:tyrosinase
MDGYAPIVPSLYAHNPRCIRRDLTSYTTTKWMTAENLLNITVGPASHSIGLFQDELQGRFKDGFLGMHGSGHFAVGGDASDFFTSTNDPSFFLHHAMVDKVYWIWQALHPKEARGVAGTITLSNRPPSRDAVKEDPLEMLVLGENISIEDAFDTMGGKFCYVYE